MIRLGILGAATIAPEAIVKPASQLARVTVAAVAARDKNRAAAFAARWDIPRVFDDYRSLVETDEVDAIYIALPAAYHAEWTRRGAMNRKHVLCEKPFSVTAKEAEKALGEASRTGVVVMDGYHYHHHPYFAEVRDSLPALGQITHIAAGYRNTVGDFPVYWDKELGGGALLHFGAYPLHSMRTVLGQEPVVTSARAALFRGLDIAVEAELDFAGVEGYLRTSMAHPKGFDNWLSVTGTDGHLHATNLICPQYSSSPPRWLPQGWDWRAQLEVTIGDEVRRHQAKPGPSSYQLQLQAFADAVEGVADDGIDPTGTLAQMVAIDAIREKGGISVA